MCPHFEKQVNFFDQRYTKDGKLYAPIRYKQIVREAYLITKNTNTTYSDVMNMTPNERTFILEFLVDEAKELEKKVQETHNNLLKK